MASSATILAKTMLDEDNEILSFNNPSNWISKGIQQ
jgi:hypothetical protein